MCGRTFGWYTFRSRCHPSTRTRRCQTGATVYSSEPRSRKIVLVFYFCADQRLLNKQGTDFALRDEERLLRKPAESWDSGCFPSSTSPCLALPRRPAAALSMRALLSAFVCGAWHPQLRFLCDCCNRFHAASRLSVLQPGGFRTDSLATLRGMQRLLQRDCCNRCSDCCNRFPRSPQASAQTRPRRCTILPAAPDPAPYGNRPARWSPRARPGPGRASVSVGRVSGRR